MLSRHDTPEPAEADRPALQGTRMQTIVVATDGSPASWDAIALGVDLAAEHHAEVHFVHVVPVIDLAPSMTIYDTGLAFPHEPTPYDYALLADAEAYAAEHHVRSTTALLGGTTAAEIVAYADDHDVDMTIVGSRGHGSVSSALLGSVSLGVLAASKRPVLIVHGKSPFPS